MSVTVPMRENTEGFGCGNSERECRALGFQISNLTRQASQGRKKLLLFRVVRYPIDATLSFSTDPVQRSRRHFGIRTGAPNCRGQCFRAPEKLPVVSPNPELLFWKPPIVGLWVEPAKLGQWLERDRGLCWPCWVPSTPRHARKNQCSLLLAGSLRVVTAVRLVSLELFVSFAFGLVVPWST